MSRKRYLVCYDVRDPGRLRRTHQKMLGFGDPLQYSVFVCDLSDVELLKMEKALKKVVNLKDDSVIIADVGPVDGAARGKIRFLSGGHYEKASKPTIV